MAQFNSYSNLLGADVANDDEMGLWDTSTEQFKNITAAELANLPQLTGKFALIASPDLTGTVTIDATGLREKPDNPYTLQWQSGAEAWSDIGASAAAAPADAHYLTTQAEDGLSAEANLGALASGLLKHTVADGVSTPAVASPGTDYLAPFSPIPAKGAAAITSFAGTVSSSGTSVTFSSAADAILAGYAASNPTLGFTIIAGGQTRHIQSWTNPTTCVVSLSPSPAWSNTAITSVQGPIAVFVNSAGVVQGYMLASGVVYLTGNVGLGSTGWLTWDSGSGTADLTVKRVGASDISFGNSAGTGNATVRAGAFLASSVMRLQSNDSPISLGVSNDVCLTRGGAANKMYLGNAAGDHSGTLATGTVVLDNTLTFTPVALGNSGAAKTVDFNSGPIQTMTLTGAPDCAITLTAPADGKNGRLTLILDQGAGAKTISFVSTVNWPGGIAPTLSVAAGAIDILSILCVAGVFYAQAGLDFK